MGEAKQKSKRRSQLIGLSRPIKPARFNLFAIGTRLAATRLISQELSYWSDADERVLGLVLRDTVDNDFGWILLMRDKIGRFRCVDLSVSLRSPDYATQGLRERIGAAVEAGDFVAQGDQKDETNYPINLLDIPPDAGSDKLHRHFKSLIDAPGRAPARAVFKELGPWLTPSDPHFVSEFQFTQFDQRLWELYLWASFRELGFDIEQPEAPDFLCTAPGIAFTVEATTVAPSTTGPLAAHPNPKTPKEMEEFLANYMPMKFGSALTSKLNKKNKAGENYWERGATANKPFILAVADFHKSGDRNDVGSMTYTQSALWPYLYGHRVHWELVNEELKISAIKNPDHVYGQKSVPSGFFDLPGAENVSAVLFSNAGTLAKFDRMGIAAGFVPADHKYFRIGVRYNHEANAVAPVPFYQEIKSEDYEEGWSDELQLFHNPNAKWPLAPAEFRGVTQHFFKDGEVYSVTPENTVMASQTMIMRLVGENEEKTVL